MDDFLRRFTAGADDTYGSSARGSCTHADPDTASKRIPHAYTTHKYTHIHIHTPTHTHTHTHTQAHQYTHTAPTHIRPCPVPVPHTNSTAVEGTAVVGRYIAGCGVAPVGLVMGGMVPGTTGVLVALGMGVGGAGTSARYPSLALFCTCIMPMCMGK